MIEVEDDGVVGSADFLSLVESAEAEAIAASKSKRQKLSSFSAAAAAAASPPAEEGLYMAALRGSRSSLWQPQQQDLKLLQRKNNSGGRGGGLRIENNPSSFSSSSVGGACFKCGMEGHWARDCNASGSNREGEGGKARGPSSVGGEDGEVPEKLCPCRSGSCLVLTSNTAKNPGRKFYRCPLKVEHGGCNFFEWCDTAASGVPAFKSASNLHSNASAPDLPCPCGAGLCLVLVTKTGKNVGRQFYRCPADEGRGSCGYFKWCSEPTSTGSQPAFASQYHGTGNISNSQYSGDRSRSNISNSQYSGDRSRSSCFKCGEEGHWSKDCPKQSSDTCAGTWGNSLASSGSGSCFKCGGAGHWARECPNQNSSIGTTSVKSLKSSRTSYSCRSKSEHD